MKKMLSILTALALGSTGAASVVACGTNEVESEGQKMLNKVEGVVSALANKSELIFNLEVNTVKESENFWKQIMDQFNAYLIENGVELEGYKMNFGFGESPNQDQLNHDGFVWHSGQMNHETGERELTEQSYIKLELQNENKEVYKKTISKLHWIIEVGNVDKNENI